MNGPRRLPKRKIRRFEFKFKFNFKTLLVWALVGFFLASFLLPLFGLKPQEEEKVSLSQALADVKEEKVEKVLVEGDKLTLTYKDKKVFTTRKEPGEAMTKIFADAGIDPTKVSLEVKDQSLSRLWLDILGTLLPLILMGVFFLFIIRQARGAQDSIFSFGQSRARLFAKGRQTISFKDVAGVKEAKKELEEVVDFLKHPGKYRALGARTPKGVLLVGPSGTGKTLLAKAIAGEANVPFFSMAGSEFMEMLVGVGASRTRDLFSNAKKAAPCLPGGTVITLADGEEITIEEMFRKKMIGKQVISMVDMGETEAAKVIAMTRRPFKKNLYKIRTFHFQVSATPNHLFPVLQDGEIIWKRADKLSEGECLVYPRKINTLSKRIDLLDFLPSQTRVYLKKENLRRKRHLKSRKLFEWKEEDVSKIDFLALGRGGWTDSKLTEIPRYLNWDLAYLIGLLLADGNFSKTNRFNISFINTEEKLHQKVKEIVRANFGYLPKTFLDSQSKRRTSPKRKNCWVTHINNRLIRLLIENLTEKILVWPEDLIAAFISGYFDGDGYVSSRNSLPKIILSEWDRRNNKLLRSLLHRLGVVAFEGSQSGNIEVTGKEAVGVLKERITSFHPKKAKRLAELKIKGRVGSRLDGVPIGNFLKKIRKSLGVSQRDLAMGGKISDYEQGKHIPSRESLRKVIYKLEALTKKKKVKLTEEFLEFKKIVFGQVGFSKICQISTQQKPCFVYDLCLNNHHNFVANGLFVHNCIIFIDEIDAIGRQRGVGFTGGHDEREQTLNQILVEMDGFTPNDNVIVMAATNRPDMLDPALVRPGRFDRRIALDMPDIEDREAILKIHARGKPFGPDVAWKKVARRTVGFSGADIENMLNEAAILAARGEKRVIGEEEIEEAAIKVKLGPAKKRLQTEEDKRLTAYHEAGHAIVTSFLPHMDPVSRISIVARGVSLGHTLIPPTQERTHETRSRLLEQITAMLGGRAAEDLVFGELTTGAANDIEMATTIARRMVIDFGMSDLGPVNLGPQVQYSDMGRPLWMEPQPLSPETAAKVDNEVKRIIDECNRKALVILKREKTKLEKVAQTLVEKETLDQEEFEKLIGKKPAKEK